jgi:hypothetical protein
MLDEPVLAPQSKDFKVGRVPLCGTTSNQNGSGRVAEVLGKRRVLGVNRVKAKSKDAPCLVRVEWQQESDEGNGKEKGAKSATKTHSKNCQEQSVVNHDLGR